ncbi:MAG: hypothetical protein ACE5H1_06685 [Thermodesulfobacteriota bacterium]
MASLDSSESLSRFILQKKWYRISDHKVKHAAFMPNPDNGETSVFRTSGILGEEIWNIGDREVGIKRGKPILGRADIIAFVVMSRDLQIIPSEPPERHANITGWPDERSRQRMVALELATEAQLHLK